MSHEDQLYAAIRAIISARTAGIDAAGIQRQLAERYPEVLRANKDLLMHAGIRAFIEDRNRQATAAADVAPRRTPFRLALVKKGQP